MKPADTENRNGNFKVEKVAKLNSRSKILKILNI